MNYEMTKQKWQGAGLIIAACSAILPTFFMKDQEFTIAGGLMIILSVPFSIIGFTGIFEKFKITMPSYTVWGFALYLFGAVASVNFGMRGVFDEIFGIDIRQLTAATQRHPAAFTLAFFVIGPAFPITLIILGINLYRKKLVKRYLPILLLLGGICFPLSRITRIAGLMHLCDLLVAIPLLIIGLSLLRKNDERKSAQKQISGYPEK
jgi:hypothetical protein